MKIKLTANSQITLPSSLSSIDVGYGYTYGVGEGECILSDNWKTKVLARFDKIMQYISPIPVREKQIVYSITESVKFLEQKTDKDDSYTRDMNIQVNINSPLNKILKKSLDLVAGISHPMALKIAAAVDTNVGRIFPLRKKMILGVDLFTQHSRTNALTVMSDRIGILPTTQLVVFHEASHSFEFTNLSKYNSTWDNFTHTLHALTSILRNDETQRNSLNIFCKENSDWGLHPVYSDFLDEVNGLFSEIYADVASILLYRNFSLSNHAYSAEKEMSIINALIDARKYETLQTKNSEPSFNYINHFNHLSSLGLEHLKETIMGLRLEVLNQRQIHNLAQKCVEVGVSRVLLSNLMADEYNVLQMKTLLNLQYNEDGSVSLPTDLNPNALKLGLEKLKELAGADWTKQFTDRCKVIVDKKLFNPEYALWHAGINLSEYEKDISECGNNTEFEIPTILQYLTKFENNNSSNITNGKKSVQDKISCIRKKSEKEEVGDSINKLLNFL